MDSEQILLVKNEDINRKKWDSTVSQSHSGALFGYTWYLDSVCRDWDALVTPDYRFVMPIPIFSNKYPLMNQYLFWTGIYSGDIVTSQLAEQFVSNIPDKYNHLYLNFNKFCEISNIENGLIRHDKVFQIDLIRPYKTRRFQTPPTQNQHFALDIKRCIAFFLVNNYQIDTMEYYKLMKEVKQRGHCMIFAIVAPNKDILGCAVIFVSQNEIYLTDISINKNIKNYKPIKNELLDAIITYFSGKNFTIYIKTNKRGVYDSFDEETLTMFDSYQFSHIYYIRNNISKLYNFFNIK